MSEFTKCVAIVANLAVAIMLLNIYVNYDPMRSAINSAAALPMPLAAPVTNTTCPAKLVKFEVAISSNSPSH